MQNVSLFVTCLIDAFRPEAAKAAVRVLERRGCHVDFPEEQTCCGQFSHNAGYRDEAAVLAKHWVEAFEDTKGPIVALSGSCAGMVIHSYPDLLYEWVLRHEGTEAEAQSWRVRAQSIADRVYELSQWLDKLDSSAPERAESSDRVPFVYHLGCHMRRLMHATTEATSLMGKTGVDLIEPEDADQCCGFGGTYSMAEPFVSTALADAKWDNIHARAQESEAWGLVGTDMGCLLHLQGRASRQRDSFPVLYLAELLDLVDEGQLTPDSVNQCGGWHNGRNSSR